MEYPLVSVVTVAYNSGKYIRDTIESVLAQSYSNIEYIIGDDCSTDDTWRIVQQYKDERIIAYRNEVNLREYPNRNKAIDLATGKYLIFIDGDDIIFTHGIEFFVRMMETFPEAGMAIQKNYYNNILFPALFEPEETLCNYFYSKSHLLASSFASNFFRTDILKEWKLPVKYVTGDEEIRLKIAAAYPIIFVAGWVTWPRETPGQASVRMKPGTGFVEGFLFSTEILKGLKGRLDDRLVADMQGMLRKNMATFIWALLTKGKIAEAKNYKKTAGFRWKEVIAYRKYQPVFNDILEKYTPVAPFKRGFLSKL